MAAVTADTKTAKPTMTARIMRRSRVSPGCACDPAYRRTPFPAKCHKNLGDQPRPQQGSGAKVLRQFEPLRLIIRTDAAAVKLVGPRQHLLIDQPADDLAVLEDERHFARAY